MPVNEDAAHVRRAQAGDRGALGHLVERYRGAVFGLCLHALGSPDDAQDATQDTFLRACQCIEQLRDPGSLPAWLAAIARRECARRRSSEPRAPDLRARPSSDDPAEVAARVDRERLAARVRQHLECLPTGSRLIYLLSCLDGLTSERIGAFVGLRPGAVRARLMRARRRLAQALDLEATEAADRAALRRLTPEVVPVGVSITAAGGCSLKAPFPDGISYLLYGYLYSGVPWREAVARVEVPENLAEAYLRTWERHLVVRRDGEAIRPLVPVQLESDTPAIAAWQHALAGKWTQAVAARDQRVAELAQAAAPDGWAATARDALCMFLPSWRLWGELYTRGLTLPTLPRPEGAGYLFGHQSGLPIPGDNGGDLELTYGYGDPMTGDGEVELAAIRYWHIRHQPDVGGFLSSSSGAGPDAPNPLPRALLSMREDPASRTSALERVQGAADYYAYTPDDLLDRLVGWRVLSEQEPHRLLLPALVGEVARTAQALAAEIAAEVAAYAEESRETLEELIRTSSFAHCNRADVLHLIRAFLTLVALAHLRRAGLIEPFPEVSFADRGPFLFATYLLPGHEAESGESR